jgi:hypothetical protein
VFGSARLPLAERYAELRATEALEPAALFIYQFECIARNRLGYDRGMTAMARDPFYHDDWRDWIVEDDVLERVEEALREAGANV